LAVSRKCISANTQALFPQRIGGTIAGYAGLRSGCAGRVSRTRRQEEQGRFLRLLALANEKADELLSRPACGIRLPVEE
jgi:hypothetical protein